MAVHIPGDALAVLHDISHALREDSDGGKRISIAEAEQIAEALAKLAADIVALVAAGKGK